MVSPVITSSQNGAKEQLTLDFVPGLLERYRSLRECVGSGIYQRGLGRVAIDLDLAPGNLSVQISDDPSRKFSVDSLERYIEKTGDNTPIMYLIEKFLAPDARPKNAHEVQEIRNQLAQAMRKLEALGGAV
ncbi:hypothetical protein [Variovorax sp. 160MFSha2.1]|uniref:hypothetical protein n=1 Tax=Variovorax sp. 160MFSha2.1 TaxID=3158367 RepID=UPI003AB00864